MRACDLLSLSHGEVKVRNGESFPATCVAASADEVSRFLVCNRCLFVWRTVLLGVPSPGVVSQEAKSRERLVSSLYSCFHRHSFAIRVPGRLKQFLVAVPRPVYGDESRLTVKASTDPLIPLPLSVAGFVCACVLCVNFW